MRIDLIAVGQKLPAWVYQACDDYIKRFPRELVFRITEIPLVKRGKNADIKRICRDEGKKLLTAAAQGSMLVALDANGKQLTTEQLASTLQAWMQSGRDITLFIGGPDGLSDEILQRAEQRLSLSKMTFPHALVRIIVAEQLYRAWSVINHHPYHRA